MRITVAAVLLVAPLVLAGCSSEPDPVPSSYGPGTYAVGQDIKPGTYRTTGPATTRGMCSARIQYGVEVGGTVAESLLNDGDPRGAFEVTVRPNDVEFRTDGCAPWVEQTSVPAPGPRGGTAT